MADDQLKLVASVEDRFTGPLRGLRTALGQVAASPAANTLKKDFEGAHGAITKTTTAIQGMAPALAAFGVGGFAAGAALSGITTAIRNFSGNTQQLSMLSRETGVAIDKLRAFGELGERFGVSTQAMQGSVLAFGETMRDLRRRWGETYTSLQAMNLGKLAEDLVNAPNMDAALKRAMEGLGNIPDPVVRRRVSRMLFGTDEPGRVAGMIGGDFEKVLADIQSKMGRTTQAQVDAAQKFEETLSGLRANMEGLRNSALTPLLRDLNRFVETLQSPAALEFFKGELDGIRKGFQSVKEEIEALVRIYQAVKGFITGGETNVRGPAAIGGDKQTGALVQRRDELRRQIDVLGENAARKQMGGDELGAQETRAKRDRLIEEMKRVGDELQKLRETGGNATVQQQSFNGAIGGGLIHRAALGGFGGVGGARATGFGGVGGAGGAAISPSAPAIAGGGPLGGPAQSSRASGASGRGGAGVPDTVPMTDAERNTLGLIMKYESQGRNVMNYVGKGQGLDPTTPKGYTAQGYFQMLNSNWRRIAPLYGIGTPNAMASSLEDQTKVALHLLRHGGVKNWANYNPALRAALARGETAPRIGAGDAAGASAEKPWYEREPTYQPGSKGWSRLRDDEVVTNDVPHRRMGDEMMLRRFGGAGAMGAAPQKVTGSASLDITFSNAPAGMKTRTNTEGMFRDVKVSKSRQMAPADWES
ncbi:hypothetical protein [Methylobacterium oryzisoli]|uniref:hypothetical protein n=1 Tax=Methylobacterium oryzisoli TaxID=3385502 RepID=UPI0038923F2F